MGRSTILLDNEQSGDVRRDARINKESETMAIKASTATRAPRGTKTLTQAFFSAADGIPEPQRAAVVKAALAAIRDELKENRDKAKAAKDKAEAKSGKVATTRGPKVRASPKVAVKALKKVSGAAAKVKKAKRTPKASPKPTPEAAAEPDAV